MNVVVFGKRGHGKTYWMKKHIESSLLPCVIIDTMNEYQNIAVWMPAGSIDEPPRFDKFKMRFTPDSEDEFDILMAAIGELQPQFGLNVYIDEVDYWSSSSYMPREFGNNLRYSRHYRLNIYMSVRNPSEINRKITALSDVFVIFRITEPRYLDYFRPFDASLPDRIESLDKYQHIIHYV